MNTDRWLVFTLKSDAIFVRRVYKGSHFNRSNQNAGITVTKLSCSWLDTRLNSRNIYCQK